MARLERVRLPAEWEPHEATWIGWPHERTDWPGKFAPIRWVYAEIVRHLAPRERVRILVESAAHREKARRVLKQAGTEESNVEFFVCPTDRGWLRDSGPLFVKDRRGAVSITDWKFNGWAKYDDWRKDNRVPDFIARRLKMSQRAVDHVLEGGSIDSNGRGVLLTTEECLLSPVQARNPELDRAGVEAMFARYLGIDKVLWLNRGIAGDDTHGHIDDIARFVRPDTILAAEEPDTSDPNHEPLRENLPRLQKSGCRVVKLPMPAPVYFGGQRLPASYANFYVANQAVLAPMFNDPNDRVACDVLAKCFPDREILPVYCRDLVLGLGTLHCLTQQQPAAG
jgi:agmatine deiminase